MSWLKDNQKTEHKAAPPPDAEKPKQEVVKVEEAVESRFKASPELWAEAIRFSKMLGYCRPHLSRTEARFINEYIRPVGVRFDKKGNIYKQIGDNPTVLWSCHIDTVHTKPGFQKIEYWVDKKSGDTFLGVAASEKSSCLGADDTCGIWLMLEMIRNNVPGLYIFHRAEEIGGIGSKWIAEHSKDAVKGIRFAIAFDRRDTESVITFQRSTRCCSDEFAKSLAEQLGMGHKCDETGSFTDTASYVDLIAECTNISAGYYNAHSAAEKTNVDYLFKLRDALLKLDVSKLVEKRKPGENTRRWANYSSGSRYGDSDLWGEWGDWASYRESQRPEFGLTFAEIDKLYPDTKKHWHKEYFYDNVSGYYKPYPHHLKRLKKLKDGKDAGVTKLAPAEHVTDDTGTRYSSYQDAVRLIRSNPEIIADLLEGQGYGSLEIFDHVRNAGGFTFN